MRQPTPSAAGSGFTISFDEPDVRRFCGRARFEQATHLEQSGHVFDPVVNENTLVARVLGTWRREFAVTIVARGVELLPSCSCGAGGFCRHAGAVLLHWLRAPSAFIADEPEPAALPEVGATPHRIDESPVEELARLLEASTLASLRELARRRGQRIRERNKVEFVPQLAAALADPTAVDAALAELAEAGRIALVATSLLNAVGPAPSDRLGRAVARLGAAPELFDLERLGESGLLLSQWYWSDSGEGWGSVVPRAVVARLPTLDRLAEPVSLAGAPPEPVGGDAAGVGAVILALAQMVLAAEGRLATTPKAPTSARYPAESAPWRLARPDGETSLSPDQLQSHAHEARLVAKPPILSAAALEALHERTGQPPAATAFALRLLVDLGIGQAAGHLTLDEERLREFLASPEPERRQILARGWLGMGGWVDLALLVGEWGTLQVGGVASVLGYSWPYAAQRLQQSRTLLARLVASATPGVWYSLSGFLDTLVDLARIAGLRQVSSWGYRRAGDQPGWWVSSAGNPEERLDLGSRAGWERMLRAHAMAQLRGPLRWLALVEVATAVDGRDALRVRPAAGALVGRAVQAEPATAPAGLALGDDLTILVPAALNDARVYQVLGLAGELVGADPSGLRYRLAVERVHALFDAGMSGPDLRDFLAGHADGPMPQAMRTQLEAWWRGYGTLRLYDDVTLIELADDLLLPELLATTSLEKHLLHQLTPRLVAVAASGVDDLVAELTRLGQQPRVLEEG